MKADRPAAGTTHRTSLERYLLMNEKEKDAEIEKAVARLQKRIQEILYLLGDEKRRRRRAPAEQGQEAAPERTVHRKASASFPRPSFDPEEGPFRS